MSCLVFLFEDLLVTQLPCFPLALISSEEQLADQAERSVALVPIRVEFETETHRIRDCFVWNLHESLVTPEEFARTFTADLDLPATWADTVAAQIRAQLEDQDGVGSMELAVDGGGDGGDEVPECRVILSVRLIPSLLQIHFRFYQLIHPRSMCRWTTTTYWIILSGTCVLGSHRKSSLTNSASTSD